jgi:MFS family permease
LLGPLAVRDFRLLWIGESISLLGDQCYLVALPWLALQLTGSGLALGTVMMAAAIPRAVFMLLGGALSDRFSPRTLMLASNAVRALLTTIITALILTGAVRLWHLYILSVAFGVVDAFFYPAFRAFIPKLLDEESLQAGNSLTQGSLQLSLMAGPAPAGYLISAFGIAMAFGFDAATFAVATFTLWLMKTGRGTISPQTPPGPQTKAAGGILSLIGEGLRYSWNNPVIRAIIFMIAAINFSFAGPFIIGLASLADRRFEAGPEAYGTMLSAWGAGALLGTLLAGVAGRTRRRGLLFTGMTVGLGAGLVMIGVIRGDRAYGARKRVCQRRYVVVASNEHGTGHAGQGDEPADVCRRGACAHVFCHSGRARRLEHHGDVRIRRLDHTADCGPLDIEQAFAHARLSPANKMEGVMKNHVAALMTILTACLLAQVSYFWLPVFTFCLPSA